MLILFLYNRNYLRFYSFSRNEILPRNPIRIGFDSNMFLVGFKTFCIQFHFHMRQNIYSLLKLTHQRKSVGIIVCNSYGSRVCIKLVRRNSILVLKKQIGFRRLEQRNWHNQFQCHYIYLRSLKLYTNL